MTLQTVNLICIIWSIIGLGAFILLQFVTAPYGRHIQNGWGSKISNKMGWILMEVPSFAIVLFFYLTSKQSNYASLLSLLWLIHYFNRSFIYPQRIRTKGKKMPLSIVFSAIFFNIINAGLNGYFLANLEDYTHSAFKNWNFIVGLLLFIFGFVVNQYSDTLLIRLRKPGEIGYKIPRGFLFEFISCPNLFGEFVQWFGFACMAWNFPASTFLIWTVANLFPRALKHHDWYQFYFSKYPKNRKAIIPWLF